jgi:hypothetical protein
MGSLDAVAWHKGNAGGTTHLVGQKEPNDFGLYDMLGNVWQWCQGWFGPYPRDPVTDPQGAPSGDTHPTRGGCYYCDAVHERAARRNRDLEDHPSLSIGFRIVAVPRKSNRREIAPLTYRAGKAGDAPHNQIMAAFSHYPIGAPAALSTGLSLGAPSELDFRTFDSVMGVTSLLPGICARWCQHQERVMRPEPTPGKLSPELLEALRGIKAVLRQFPKGALLFEQGFPVTAVYLAESGEVRILLPTGNKQNQLLEVAGPGTILGLSESISGENYKVTAEAGDQTSAAFIPRRGFLEWDRVCF